VALLGLMKYIHCERLPVVVIHCVVVIDCVVVVKLREFHQLVDTGEEKEACSLLVALIKSRTAPARWVQVLVSLHDRLLTHSCLLHIV